MQLYELIIRISQYNNTNEYEEFIKEAEAYNISVLFDFSSVKNPEEAYLITDSRKEADKGKELGIGFAVYLTEESRESDFADALYMIDDISGVGIQRIIRMYQRYQGIPWHILDTKRFSLHEMTLEDLDGIYGVYDDPEVSKYAGAPYYDREKALEYIKNYIEIQYRFYEYGIWLVKDKKSGEIIGRAGLTGRAGYEDAELGYVFAKRVWGRGYATEVISGILEYAKNELFLDKVNAFVIPENVVSVHILNKFGFKDMGKVILHDEEHIFMQLDL